MDEFLGFIVLAAVIVIPLSIAGKGCNDSDNALIKAAVEKGCSVVKEEHHDRSFLCHGEKTRITAQQ